MDRNVGPKDALLLDTHTWIWLLADSDQLASVARQKIALAQADKRVFGSIISVLETANLESKGRIHLPTGIHSWLEESFADDGIQLLPLSPEIAVASTRLPGTIHGDPADRILIATARIHNLTLLTRDKQLLTYGRKGHVHVQSV